jgi:heme-degrading monooxygenase HmoA
MRVLALNQAAAKNIANAARDAESLLKNAPGFEETSDIKFPDAASESPEVVTLHLLPNQ